MCALPPGVFGSCAVQWGGRTVRAIEIFHNASGSPWGWHRGEDDFSVRPCQQENGAGCSEFSAPGFPASALRPLVGEADTEGARFLCTEIPAPRAPTCQVPWEREGRSLVGRDVLLELLKLLCVWKAGERGKSRNVLGASSDLPGSAGRQPQSKAGTQVCPVQGTSLPRADYVNYSISSSFL